MTPTLLAQVDEGIGTATAFLKALAESGFPTALIFLGLVFLVYMIIDRRSRSSQDERDAKRSQMDAQNLANALSNRDSETAKELAANTKATVAAAETALAIANRAQVSAETQRVAIESNTAAIQHGNQPRLDLIAATVAQTTEFGGLREGIDKQQTTMATGFDGFLKEFDDLKGMASKTLKAVEARPDMYVSIIALLELNTKLLRKTLEVLTPRDTDNPPTVASIEAASDAVGQIAPDQSEGNEEAA